MCLLVIAFGVDREQPLIVAGNRDEFHARPATPAGWWDDAPETLGGRDLQAGGTWLAVSRRGRFATVTNYRDAVPADPALRSRGHLVSDFLASDLQPQAFLEQVDTDAYAGFNLLVSDGRALAYLSNRGGRPRELVPGIYGLSNATLDIPWTKVERSKRQMEYLLGRSAAGNEQLLELLANPDRGPFEEAAGSRLPTPVAHALTAPFIVLPDYGTRCSTVVRVDRSGRWEFVERRFDPTGSTTGESRYSFTAA